MPLQSSYVASSSYSRFSLCFDSHPQTINRIAEHMGWDTWKTTTKDGVTVKAAIDYAMTKPAGSEDPTELYPDVAAVAMHYGDPDGKYAAWLAQEDTLYPGEAFFFWEQPLSDSGLKVYIDQNQVLRSGTPPASAAAGGSNESSGSKNAASARMVRGPTLALAMLVGCVGAALL